ncbi:MAG: CheY-like chemotaxis protein [Saprospiraceae bacterium]|jgi:CheY-like chemotaxis protein
MEEIKESKAEGRFEKEKKYSLLYVDDEATNLRVFKSNFRKFFKVYTTTNPFEAIEILKENSIQVVVTDQRMPEMTGTQFLETILPDHPDIIKIILTGFTDIEAIKDGINRCGIYKYITKPWNFDEMKGLLDRAMESYQDSLDTEEHVKVLEVSNVELEQRVKERTEELNSINKRLIDSIRYAGLLQQSMLPNERYLSRIFTEHFVMYRNKYLFSEEFIWTTSLNFRSEDYTVIALIEFDGKGIVGSLKTLIADSVLNDLIQDRKIFHSGDIIRELTQELDAAGSKELQCDLKVSVALFDNNAKTLQFSGVDQDMIIFTGNEMVVLEGESKENINDLMADKIELTNDATYYMFSNGYFNQQNQDGVKFSQEKFEEMLKSVQKKSLADQYKFLTQTIEDWVGDNGMSDDISIIGFKL